MPFDYTEKKPGDLLQSSDWNAAMRELKSLGDGKLNRQGQDALSGPLTVQEGMTKF